MSDFRSPTIKTAVRFHPDDDFINLLTADGETLPAVVIPMPCPVIIIVAGHIVVMVAVPPVGSRMPVVMAGVVPATMTVVTAHMDAAAAEVKPEARGLGR